MSTSIALPDRVSAFLVGNERNDTMAPFSILTDLTEWVTVAQAMKELDLTFWQIDYSLKKHHIQTIKLGQMRLIGRSDLQNSSSIPLPL